MTSEIRISNITNRTGTSGAVIAGVTSSIGTGYAKIPSGDNTQRVGIEEGSLRYNETAKLLEFYDGTQWNFIIPAEESANAIGVFGPGFSGPSYDYITISTLGDAKEFGNTYYDSYNGINAACSSSTRGVFGGGYTATTPLSNIIEYITISSQGNSTDFGDLTVGKQRHSACSSSTRGIFGGGSTPTYVNTIDYITIATTGNATTFGQLTQDRSGLAACSSSTRGIFGSGQRSPANVNTIDYITIASQGTNAQDFGDLSILNEFLGSCSSSTRGVFGGGGQAIYYPSTDLIEYITIATTGNSINFGDLTISRGTLASCSSSTRGVFGGGYDSTPTAVNTIDYITIATTGNATDFGDLTVARGYFSSAACSNNHGGLL